MSFFYSLIQNNVVMNYHAIIFQQMWILMFVIDLILKTVLADNFMLIRLTVFFGGKSAGTKPSQKQQHGDAAVFIHCRIHYFSNFADERSHIVKSKKKN